MDRSRAPHPATGFRRLLYCTLGLTCVGFGYLGAILPGVPVTPFLLAASYFFVRSSPRLHRWLRRSPWFGRLLHDWEEHRGIRRSVKITACCLIVAAVSASIILADLPTWGSVVIAVLALIGITVILMLPTVSASASNPATVSQPDETS